MGCDLVDTEAQVLGRQIVVNAREVRLTVAGSEHRARHHAVKAPGCLTDRTGRHVAVPDMVELLGAHLVPLLGRLVAENAGLAPALVIEFSIGCGVVHGRVFGAQPDLGVTTGHGADRIRRRRTAAVAHAHVQWIVVEHGLLFHQTRHLFNPGPRERADEVNAGNRAGSDRIGRAQAQARDRKQHTGAGTEQSHLHQVAPFQSGLGNFALDIHGSLDQFFT